ncbi:MAG TPA: general stress protein [Candidatus Obscuribacterales bacterium]
MAVSDQKRAVGVFANREEVEQAVNELKDSGFSMDKVSIIAKDAGAGDHVGGAEMSDRVGDQDVNTATAAVADAVTGATWGTVLVGLSSLAIPGVGPIVAAGSLGVAMVTNLAGIAIGTASSDGLVRAMTDLGIPEEQARGYSDRLHLGKYLAIVDGTDDDIHRAEAVFNNRGIQDWGVYTPSQA